MSRIVSLVIVSLVRVYQVCISPLLPPSCRFSPSCSEYARQAVLRFGAAKGAGMACLRICRCHPFHSGGYDPVPDKPSR